MSSSRAGSLSRNNMEVEAGGGGGGREEDDTSYAKPGPSPTTPSRSHRNLSSHSFRRPSSPLQPLSDSTSNRNLSDYSFPPPSNPPTPTRSYSPGTSPTSMTMSTTAQHRMSFSHSRPRRPSPLLHEIQPPSRRLSAHQMLLLTPFGGVVPPGTLGAPLSGASMTSTATAMGAGMGMQRGSSSMGRSHPYPSSSPRGSVTMNIGPSSIGRHDHLSHLPTRNLRHQSLANPANPSPLASAPMTTIPSASDAESSSSSHPSSVAPSRETSNNVDGGDIPRLIGGTPGTVPMTRSNSLPVLTLRELNAMKEKDGELGIARGGGWAWVSRESDMDIDEDDDDGGETPMLDSTGPTASSTSLSSSTSNRTSASITPPAAKHNVFPFTAFNDPFAPPSTSSSSFDGPDLTYSHSAGMSRDSGPSSHGPFAPTATTPGYHYSPTHNDTRRMSDALAFQLPSGTGSRATHSTQLSPGNAAARRPSAPVATLTARQSFAESDTTPTRNTDRDRFDPSSSIGQSPRGGITSTIAPSRPKITRYKSLPGRSQGLGLSIVVKPQPHPHVHTGPPSATTDSRRESEASSSSKSAGRVRRRSKPRGISGNWAAIDVVDSLAGSELGSSNSNSISPISSNRGSVHSSNSPSRQEMLFVEEISSRAHLSEFGQKPGGNGMRGRFESIDSALPLVGVSRGPGGDGYVAALAQGGWNATFPRRGSLAVLSRPGMSSWVQPLPGQSAGGGLGMERDRNKAGLGEMGSQLGVGMGMGGHWSERRGSWAEGWVKKEEFMVHK